MKFLMMNDEKIEVCRLCLGLINYDECQHLDMVSKDILKAIVPQVNLDISAEPKVCQRCNKTMLRSYRFKNSRKNEEKTDTEKLDQSKKELIDVHDEPLGKKCSFCSRGMNSDSLTEFNSRKVFFDEALNTCMPDWNHVGSSNEVLSCNECAEILFNMYKFVGNCGDTEDKLNNYCLTKGTNSQGKVSLFEVVQFVLDEGSNSESTIACEDKEIQFNASDIKLEPLEVEEIYIKSEMSDGEISGIEFSEWSTDSTKGQSNSTKSKTASSTSTQTKQLYASTEAVPVTYNTATQSSDVVQKPDGKVVLKRSIGVQVYPRDLIQVVHIGIQVDLPFEEPVSPVTEDSEEDTVSSSTVEQSKRRRKFKPRILRKKRRLSQ